MGSTVIYPSINAMIEEIQQFDFTDKLILEISTVEIYEHELKKLPEHEGY